MTQEVLKQALEALEYHQAQTRPIVSTQLAIDALRAALNAPAAPQAVPEGWREVMQELIDINTEPAGLTKEIVDSKDAFKAFMAATSARVDKAIENAKAMLAAAPSPKEGK